jgi:hypothetical protein
MNNGYAVISTVIQFAKGHQQLLSTAMNILGNGEFFSIVWLILYQSTKEDNTRMNERNFELFTT